jgi:hypothetical protein
MLTKHPRFCLFIGICIICAKIWTGQYSDTGRVGAGIAIFFMALLMYAITMFGGLRNALVVFTGYAIFGLIYAVGALLPILFLAHILCGMKPNDPNGPAMLIVKFFVEGFKVLFA